MDNKSKRITIYDIAKELSVSPSYVSKALNNHPLVSDDMKEKVKQKALALKYKQNSYAANLRKGISRTIGVIVPQINKSFFSDAIAGIEEVCSKENYGLVICQSHDSYTTECKALDTLVRQNVDCILISISKETINGEHIKNIINNGTPVIQFDRFIDGLDSYRVINDNENMSYIAVKHLIEQGYNKIAYIGGDGNLSIYRLREKGYIKALLETNKPIENDLILYNAFSEKEMSESVIELLSSENPPDAFLTGSDHSALLILQIANNMGIKVPESLGIIGSGNDILTQYSKPSLSAIDQKSMELGRKAASIYFNYISKKNDNHIITKEEIITADIQIRESTLKKNQ